MHITLIGLLLSASLVSGTGGGGGTHLGEACRSLSECLSGCCWYGVCRAGLPDCSPGAQLDTYAGYKAAIGDIEGELDRMKALVSQGVRKSFAGLS